MKLSKAEQETIITWNNEDKTANIYTYDIRLTNKLEKLVESGNENIKKVNNNGFDEYIVPKRWVKVNPPRKMSEEQLAKLRASGVGFKKKNPQDAV